jgi:hypothetical protein
MGNDVKISTPIYRKADVFYKDSECKDPFYDQKAAAVLWHQKQKIDHPIKASIEDGVLALVKVVAFVLVCVGAVAVWGLSAEIGWRSHDELITVDSRNWANGEYKSCKKLYIPKHENYKADLPRLLARAER